MTLKTLADVRNLMCHLPAATRKKSTWRHIAMLERGCCAWRGSSPRLCSAANGVDVRGRRMLAEIAPGKRRAHAWLHRASVLIRTAAAADSQYLPGARCQQRGYRKNKGVAWAPINHRQIALAVVCGFNLHALSQIFAPAL
jgi:hypothetical protein